MYIKQVKILNTFPNDNLLDIPIECELKTFQLLKIISIIDIQEQTFIWKGINFSKA